MSILSGQYEERKSINCQEFIELYNDVWRKKALP